MPEIEHERIVRNLIVGYVKKVAMLFEIATNPKVEKAERASRLIQSPYALIPLQKFLYEMIKNHACNVSKHRVDQMIPV